MCHWLARYACLLALVCVACVCFQWKATATQFNVWPQSFQTVQTHPSVALQSVASNGNQQRSSRLRADADLQLNVLVERAVVQRGSNYAYSLLVKNQGPSTATGTKLTAQIPVGMSYIIASPTQGSCFNSNGTITCNLGSIEVGQIVSILLGVALNDRAQNGSSLVFNASVGAEQNDPQTENNRVSLSTLVSSKPAIAGRVTDKDSKPLAGISLNISGSTSTSRNSDSEGNYVFDDLATGGNYTLTPARAGFWFDPPSRNFPEFTSDQTANFVANPCLFSVGPTTINIPSGGGNASVTVNTTSRCTWTASTQTPWITLLAGVSSSGNGQLDFNVSPTSVPRIGRLTVAGQEIVVYQVANSCPVPEYRNGTLLTQSITLDSQPFAADFNNDGIDELLVFLTPTADFRPVAIYSLSERTNALQSWSELRAPLGKLTPAAADFNTDGKMDLLLVSSSDNSNATGQIYYGNGQGGWNIADKIQLSSKPLGNLEQVIVTDLYGDKRPDIVLAGGPGANYICVAYGSNQFAAPLEMGLGNERLFAIADFSGTESVDILSGTDRTLRLKLDATNNTNVRVPVLTQLEAPLTLYAVKDVNGDNRADLLMGSSRLADGKLLTYLSQGNGRFDAPMTVSINQTLGNGSYQFIVDDFNGDARSDVMLMINTATRLFLAGDGTGRFSSPITIELPFESRSFVSGRFTRDTSLDLFALGQGQFANQLQLFTSSCGASSLMIYGRVTEGQSNRGVAGVTLKLSGNKTATTKSDLGGYYEFNQLPARYGYVVTTESNEFEFAPGKAETTYLTKDAQFSFQARRRVSAVSAASYSNVIAPDSIITLFGNGLATATQVATTSPLPEALGNTTIKFTDANLNNFTAKLFFVSPNQVNLLVPAGLAAGDCKLSIGPSLNAADRAEISSLVRVENVAPGIFTSDSSGRGLPSAVLLRVSASGRQSYEAISRYDVASSRFVPIPIDLSNTSEQVFLLLYGTGMRNRAALNDTMANVGGLEIQPLYVGPQGSLAGLDQVNLRLPSSLRGRGDVAITITIEGKASNTTTINIR